MSEVANRTEPVVAELTLDARTPPEPYRVAGGATVYGGDCLDVLRTLPDESFDAIVTDPPYGLREVPTAKFVETMTRWTAGDRDYVPQGRGFMGRGWDAFVPPPAAWDECARLLKPGGQLISFAGARTFDLMGLAIRLAGFEIRDGGAWLYSSGMPKTTDVGKMLRKAGRDDIAEDWSGWASTVKPAFEPMVFARKPFRGPLIENIARHGVGAFNIDACRIEFRNDADRAETTAKNQHTDFGTLSGRNMVYGDYSTVESKNYDGSKGRWPSNVFLDEDAAAELDRQSGVSRSYKAKPRSTVNRRATTDSDDWGATHTGAEYDDVGGASRFFYVAKANAAERPVVAGVRHDTVKPLALMRQLARLVTPPGGRVLDPFGGSGTTAEAAILEGFEVVLVEREAIHLPLIDLRLDRLP